MEVEEQTLVNFIIINKKLMARRVRWKSHARCRVGEEVEIISNPYLSLLIVWDFINFAKTHDIPVGPGRGSGAGSIAAYAIGITNLDPMKYNLLFEREEIALVKFR